MIYSPVLLKDMLPPEHYRCWLLFVRSCCILCSHSIKETDIISADLLLLQFCRKFKCLYGNMSCTFNMHLHVHIKQTLLDFGPPHASWCFPFERYNGILGSYHTNNRSIEPQIMRKFCQNQAVHSLKCNDLSDEFNLSLPYNTKNVHAPKSIHLFHFAFDPLNSIDNFAISKNEAVSSLPPIYQDVLNAVEADELEHIYTQLYPLKSICHIPRFCYKFGRLMLAGNLIGSDMPGPNSKSSSVIMAFWCDHDSTVQNINYNRMCVGIVQYFLKHKLFYTLQDGQTKKEDHIFAFVYWKHLHENHDWFGSSATVCTNMFEPCTACCFLPVQRIAHRCAAIKMPVSFHGVVEDVFIACPIPLNYCM